MENRLNHERLIASLEELGKIGVGKDGQRNRLALSDGDKAARDLLCKWIKEAGLDLKIDPIGNIFGVLSGTEDGDPVIAGSHIDTVPNAGMFDGCVGVLSALEALRTIAGKKLPHRCSLAVAAWTNEEGSRFLPGVLGSSVFVGDLPLEKALAARDFSGVTAGDELARIGYAGCDTLKASAYMEFHVEQGPFLDAQKLEIGVVTGITGLSRWDVTYKGEANHAGTTPMNLRHDPLVAASKLHLAMSAAAAEKNAVFTVGHVEVSPGAVNVVPGRTFFTIDLRSQDRTVLDELHVRCEAEIRRCAREEGVDVECIPTDHSDPVSFAPGMIEKVERFAKLRGLSNRRMGSGAGHDAQVFAPRVPTAMIFVPSIGGKSHCPEELSDMNLICQGAEILTDCLLELANE